MNCRRYIRGENARRLQAQNRAHTLATGEDAVAHSRVNGGWLHGFGREQPLQRSVNREPVLFKEGGKFHRGREEACSRPRNWFTFHSPALGRKARRQVSRRLF